MVRARARSTGAEATVRATGAEATVQATACSTGAEATGAEATIRATGAEATVRALKRWYGPRGDGTGAEATARWCATAGSEPVGGGASDWLGRSRDEQTRRQNRVGRRGVEIVSGMYRLLK